MGGQEEAAEGFLRRLAAFRNRWWPKLEVAVVDCEGGGGRTAGVIRLLAEELVYPVVAGGFRGEEERRAAGGELYYAGKGVYFFDARGLTGKKLLQAPVFRFLEVKLKAELTE